MTPDRKLDASAADFLALMKKLNVPGYQSLSVEDARRLYASGRKTVTPEPPDVPEVRDIAASGPHGGIPLRLYRPAHGTLPVLVFFHGGGWVVGDLETHDVVCRHLALSSGCAVIAVDYRMGPEFRFPGAVEDAWAALQWIAEHGSGLDLDVGRLAVGGDSAGGNLAATVAIMARDAGGPAIAYQLLIYPSVDQRGGTASRAMYGSGYVLSHDEIVWFHAQYLATDDDKADWRASPLLAKSHADLPPAYVVVAGCDGLRDEGLAYAAELRLAGVPVSVREWPGQVHGFITMGRVIPQAGWALHEMGLAVKAALTA
jgi:acetyl esterase